MSPWICIFVVFAREWVGGLYISGVDFGYFSTSYRDCEALKMREE